MLNYDQPDARGHFGPYGGTFVAETLIHALDELKAAYAEVRSDSEFQAAMRAAFISTTLTSMSGAFSAIIAMVGPPT